MAMHGQNFYINRLELFYVRKKIKCLHTRPAVYVNHGISQPKL